MLSRAFWMLSGMRLPAQDKRGMPRSLGVILYEMIVGRWIIESAEPGATVTQILTEEVTPPSQQISGIPEELDKIVMKAIAKRKEDRYQDVSALTEDLKKVSENQGVLKR